MKATFLFLLGFLLSLNVISQTSAQSQIDAFI
jgi:hypothetical protein